METKETLAEEFLQYKNDSLKNILKMGEVLYKAKDFLEKGEFHSWLKDSRINISSRTAQRFMMAFKNFRHLLSQDKSELLTDLDISHLLELKNVPDRFKKSIEIDNKGQKEIVDVIDEEKVCEFINKQVEVNGKVGKVKNLSLKYFKQQIQEVGGEYKDLKEPVKNSGSVVGLRDSPIPLSIQTKESGYSVLLKAVPIFTSDAYELFKKIDSLDSTTVFEMTPDDRGLLIKELKRLSDMMSGLIVKINEKEGVLN